MASLRIAACQLNLLVGDLDGNREKIIAAYKEAEALTADIAVFTELAVCGYPPEDLLLKSAFIEEVQTTLKIIAAEIQSCVAVIGFVSGEEVAADPIQRTANAAAICAQGKNFGVYQKRALPDYGVFDEERYFAPGTGEAPVFEICGVKVGVTICEDIWMPEGVVADLAANGAQIILNLNASPYEQGKIEIRQEVLQHRVIESQIPIVYVNQVGGQDELVFDGGSMAIGIDKKIVARAPQFKETVMTFDIEPAPLRKSNSESTIEIPSSPKDYLPPKGEVEAPISSPHEPLAEVWHALCLATHDYLKKNKFTDVVIGLSGGIDSAIVATIACDALGPAHVHTVALPSRFSSDHSIKDAAHLAENLGCDHRVIPIEQSHAAFLDTLAEPFSGLSEDITEENLQARIRGTILMALSNKFSWLVLTTGNKSELAVGYSTLYGDTAGAFAVIKDLWKTQVYDLARWKNSTMGEEYIPLSIIEKSPSAELRPNQRDEDSLPPYDILDALLRGIVERDKVVDELIQEGYESDMVRHINRLVDLAEYKRRQNPIGPKISPKAFGRDRRVPIVNAYNRDLR
ncbi:MAG: NAD+ synthase [Acidimicrobiaceae bacterium]|nr:NAD+ synthase [Acidimicrobiaceae bacterium]